MRKPIEINPHILNLQDTCQIAFNATVERGIPRSVTSVYDLWRKEFEEEPTIKHEKFQDATSQFSMRFRQKWETKMPSNTLQDTMDHLHKRILPSFNYDGTRRDRLLLMLLGFARTVILETYDSSKIIASISTFVDAAWETYDHTTDKKGDTMIEKCIEKTLAFVLPHVKPSYHNIVLQLQRALNKNQNRRSKAHTI